MSDAIRSAAPGELDGLALARLVSRLGVEIRTPCTFRCDGGDDFAAAWERWLETCFSPHLAPVFVGVRRLAGELRIEGIVELDRRLDGVLGAPLRASSLAAARAFLEGKAEMRANPEWRRFAEAVAEGRSPGHAPVLFALQTALYHLPLASALAAYLWFELESGLPRTPDWRARAGGGAAALNLFSAAQPQLRLAMAAHRGEFADDGAPRLRAI